jgi:hypothetical protein
MVGYRRALRHYRHRVGRLEVASGSPAPVREEPPAFRSAAAQALALRVMKAEAPAFQTFLAGDDDFLSIQ